jgi:DNA-binding CsgD family transcriptional regulator
MTGYGDIPMCVRAMKAGAVDFLSKPFRDQDMIDAVTAAINRDGLRRASENRAVAVVDHYASLSPREREVMALVTAGKMNKQIAAELGLSEVTVKIHRGAAMRKIGRPFAGGSRAHGGRTEEQDTRRSISPAARMTFFSSPKRRSAITSPNLRLRFSVQEFQNRKRPRE